MHADGLRAAQQLAEVIHILNGIEDQQKRVFVFLTGIIKNLLQGGVFSRLDYGQAALVYRALAELVESLARDCFDGNLPPPSLLKYSRYGWRVALALCQEPTRDPALPPQSFHPPVPSPPIISHWLLITLPQ